MHVKEENGYFVVSAGATIMFDLDNERWNELGGRVAVNPRKDGWDIVDFFEAITKRIEKLEQEG